MSHNLDASAGVIWGARVDDDMEGRIRVITIITGVNSTCILGANQVQDEKTDVSGHFKDIGLDMI